MNKNKKKASLLAMASFVGGIVLLVYGIAATKREGATELFSASPSAQTILLIAVSILLIVIGSISLFENLKR